ncbi:MAG: helix-turn-helix domain-containing protein [Acidobacteriaceae bacterium]|nr:helix-turn-helix domain-containing protein [Acidobacteriaceae bacterium]
MDDSKLSRYKIPIVSKTFDVIEAFRKPREKLTLEQVIRRTAVSHTTTYRILHTLMQRGYIIQVPGKKYRLNTFRKRPKLGFATLTRKTSFAVAIAESLQKASADAGFQFIMYDNDRDPNRAVSNAQALVSEASMSRLNFNAMNKSRLPSPTSLRKRAYLPSQFSYLSRAPFTLVSITIGPAWIAAVLLANMPYRSGAGRLT